MSSSPKTWGGRTLDDRSADRRGTLLDAAEELLGDGGASAVTMRAVVRTADLSPRYFYESFASREELLAAVYDRTEAALLAALADLDTSQDFRGVVRSTIERLRVFFAADPRRARILLREPLADDTLRSHSTSRMPLFVQALLPLLGAHGAAFATLPEQGTGRWKVTMTALSGALVAVYLEYVDGRIEIEPDELVDSAVDLVFSLLRLA